MARSGDNDSIFCPRRTHVLDLDLATTDFVAFDLETTGLDPVTDRVVEIGAVRFAADGTARGVFESLVNPGRPSGPGALAVHGISDAELARAPDPGAVLPRFVAFLGPPGRTILVAHGATTDAGFLGAELARLGLPLPPHPVIDTLAWSRARWPGPTRHKLGHLADRLGLDPGSAHRALADARRVVGLTLVLRDGQLPGETPLAYPIFDGRGPTPPPLAWQAVETAIRQGSDLQIEYEGGSRGSDPRLVTPTGFVHRGGVAYLNAVCHHDGRDKEFRLDRVRRFEIRPRPAPLGPDGSV